jgi:hypothetical protein
MTFPTGKCPKCATIVTRVAIERVDIFEDYHKRRYATSLVCSNCRTVLGVSIDPIALNTEMVAEIVQEIRKTKEP